MRVAQNLLTGREEVRAMSKLTQLFHRRHDEAPAPVATPVATPREPDVSDVRGGNTAATERLHELLAAPPPEDYNYLPINNEVSKLLPAFESAQQVEPLIDVLTADLGGSYTGDPREEAAAALTRIGGPAVEPLVAALDRYDGYPQYDITSVLGRIGDARAVEPLIRVLEGERCPATGGSAMALGRTGDPRAVQPLIDALADEEERIPVIGALGELGDRRAVEPLADVAVDDPRAYVRERAREALADLDPEALDALDARVSYRGVRVGPETTVVAELIGTGHHYDESDPITFAGSGAKLYSAEQRWWLDVPTGSKSCPLRRTVVDPAAGPDAFVFDFLARSPGWHLTTAQIEREHALSRLMEAGEGLFVGDNPIVIEDVAHVYYDDHEHDWILKVRVSEIADRRIPFEMLPQGKGFDEAVLDAIAGTGLSLM